jgi:hypothetical protein
MDGWMDGWMDERDLWMRNDMNSKPRKAAGSRRAAEKKKKKKKREGKMKMKMKMMRFE